MLNEEKDQNNIEVFSLDDAQAMNNLDIDVEKSQVTPVIQPIEHIDNITIYNEVTQGIENQEYPQHSNHSMAKTDVTMNTISSNEDNNSAILPNKENESTKINNKHNGQNKGDIKSNFMFMIVLAIIMLVIVIILPYISGFN